MTRELFTPLLVAGLLLCGGTTSALQPGYLRGTHATDGGMINGALCFDDAGRLLHSHASDSLHPYDPDQIKIQDYPSGSTWLYADGFGAVASIVWDAPEGILFVADNEDSTGNEVWRLRDLNADDDCLDVGEVLPYASHPDLDNLADLALSPTGSLYATDADGAGAGDVWIMEDRNGDGDALDLNVSGRDETRIWATDVESIGTWDFLAGILVDGSGPVDLVTWQDSAGVLRVGLDMNSSGDADDPGEWAVWVTGLNGGIDLAWSPEGDIYASGSTYGSHAVERIDPAGVVTELDAPDAGDVFWTGALAFDSPTAPFTSGSGPNGNVLHMAYSDPLTYLSMAETLTYTPDAPDVPTTGPLGLTLLAGLLGALLVRRRSAGA